MLTDPGQQFRKPKRLADEVHSTEIETIDNRLVIIYAGKHYHRHLNAVLLPLSDNFETTEPWHQLIDDHEVKSPGLALFIGFEAVPSGGDVISAHLEAGHEQHLDVFSVISHKDLLFFTHLDTSVETCGYIIAHRRSGELYDHACAQFGLSYPSTQCPLQASGPPSRSNHGAIDSDSDSIDLLGPHCEFQPVAGPELGHEAGEVSLDSAEADVELVSYLGVGATPGDGEQDFFLSGY